MLRRRYLLAATLVCAAPLLLVSRAAQPQTAPKEKPHPIDAFYDACVEKHPSTAGMMDCAEQAHAKWDKALNKDYQQLLKQATPKTRTKLRDSQRAWIAYRDKEWAAQNEIYNRDGTMWGPVRAGTHLRVTKERALQIADYLSDYQPR